VEDPSPAEPWALVGEVIVAAVGRRGRRIGPPASGLEPIPGPALLIAARYQASPVGPFLEVSLLEPARLGPRPSWSVTRSVVDQTRALADARRSWGVPREVGSLRWEGDGRRVRVASVEQGLVLTAAWHPVALPIAVPVRALQRGLDGPVSLRLRLRGLGYPARVDVSVAAGPLEVLRGRHRGLFVASPRVWIGPARPVDRVPGRLVTPRRVPDPGVAGSGLARHAPG